MLATSEKKKFFTKRPVKRLGQKLSGVYKTAKPQLFLLSPIIAPKKNHIAGTEDALCPLLDNPPLLKPFRPRNRRLAPFVN